jgi:3D (Asp-Asp-Asp) domain-containing protein
MLALAGRFINLKQITKSIIGILAFVMVVTISLPKQSFNIIASDADLVYVTLVDGGYFTMYKTGTKTVESFLLEADIGLSRYDTYDHLPFDRVREGMVINITRGLSVQVGINGDFQTRGVPAHTTVEQLQLQMQTELNIALLFNGDASQMIADHSIVNFLTWQNDFHTISEPIPYDIIEYQTTAVRDGRNYVRQPGANGLQDITTSTVIIGGRVSQRVVADIRLIARPIDEIVDIGIGGRLGTLTDTTAPDFHYRYKMLMNASAYTAGFGCTGKHPDDPWYGITASGRYVQHGVVAVDPTVIPLGTNLYVEGYGFALASDVGSAIKGNKIDLFYYEVEDALRFGRQDIMVYILD